MDRNSPSIVRAATVDDLATVIRHRHAMFAEMGFPVESLRAMDREARPYFAHAFEEGTYHHWFVDCGGHVAASAGVSVTPFYPGPRDARPQRAWMLNVYTEPEYRRLGMAARLVEVVIEWCRGNGIGNLYLHASEFGRPLYERLGFVSSNEMRLDLGVGGKFTDS
jgi:GNAT superfamily N-acetyltransferase